MRSHKQTASAAESAVVTIQTLTPLEELLLVHPGPWSIVPYHGWRGPDPPDHVVLDGRGYAIEFIDDPQWRLAVAMAINLAMQKLKPPEVPHEGL